MVADVGENERRNKMRTVEDLKRIWTVKVGAWLFTEEAKKTVWKQFVKECKRDFNTTDEAYNYYHKMWFGW